MQDTEIYVTFCVLSRLNGGKCKLGLEESRRQSKLSFDETCHLREWCIKPFRGKESCCFCRDIFAMRPPLDTVRPMRTIWSGSTINPCNEALPKLGGPGLGMLVFIEIFGAWFQYSWERRAFKETRRLFFVQNLG